MSVTGSEKFTISTLATWGLNFSGANNYDKNHICKMTEKEWHHAFLRISVSLKIAESTKETFHQLTILENLATFSDSKSTRN